MMLNDVTYAVTIIHHLYINVCSNFTSYHVSIMTVTHWPFSNHAKASLATSSSAVT